MKENHFDNKQPNDAKNDKQEREKYFFFPNPTETYKMGMRREEEWWELGTIKMEIS